jgi:hypothetical protein
VTPVVEVTLAYEDSVNRVTGGDTFALTSTENLVWKLPIKDPNKRSFTTKITYNRADGRVIEGPVTVAADNKITVPKLIIPEVSCLMVPKLLDFAATPAVSVDIHYVDPDTDLDQTDSFVFTDATNQQWRLEVGEDSPRSFEVTVTYDLADGTVVKRDPVTLSTPKIVVPKYVPAR